MLSLSLLHVTTFFEYETNIPYISTISASKIVEIPNKKIVGFTTADRQLLKTVLCKLLKSVLYIQYLLIHYLYKVVPTMYYHIKDRR